MARLQHVLLRHNQDSTGSVPAETSDVPGAGGQNILINAITLSNDPMMMLTVRTA